MIKVLIALDYDPTAQKVAEEGYALAKAMCAGVILLHVVAEPPVFYSSTMYAPIMGFGGYQGIDISQSDVVVALEKASREFLDKTKKHLGDETIKCVVKDGDVTESLSEAAKEFGASIIVMGSHSRTWLDSIVIGSVTEKVLRETTIPLFIIPTKKRN